MPTWPCLFLLGLSIFSVTEWHFMVTSVHLTLLDKLLLKITTSVGTLFHLAPSRPISRISRPCLSVPSCQLWKSLCAGWAVAQSLELDQLALARRLEFRPPISRNTPGKHCIMGTQHLLKIGRCYF